MAALLFIHQPTAEAQADAEMLAAARAFLLTLDEDQRAAAVFPFESDERFKWHYSWVPRRGLPLKQMTQSQRDAALALLRTAVSETGYRKARDVIELERVLFELEGGSRIRDAELYYFSIFGTPAAEAPWGWRLEGHHLSLHFTAVTQELTAVTPAFYGANPADVDGWRVLEAEEDRARDLLASLDHAQRQQAIVGAWAPRDILHGPEPQETAAEEGLAAAAMTEAQQRLLHDLLDVYFGNMQPEEAARYRQRMEAAGFDQVRFVWAGGTAPGEGHYYRIQGPTLVIEYDNTQNGANHIHTVWHDPTENFGGDLLRQHYRDHAHD